MKLKPKAVLIFFLVLALTPFLSFSGKTEEMSHVKGPFLGQKPPEKTPEIFAPGIISTEKSEQNALFSPDGKAFYFTKVMPGFKFVSYMMQMDGGRWTMPEIAPFYKSHEGGEVFIAPEGQHLFFVARQNKSGEKTKTGDIWVMNKKNGKWSKPFNLNSPVNTGFHEGYPTTSGDGTLYFFSNREDSLGGFDIFYSERVNGRYSPPKNLGMPVNSKFNEFNPCIAPDGSYLIFNSPNRPGGLGQQDLYITFRHPKGNWSEPKNMGKMINTEYNDYSAFVTADGRYLFFSSNRMMKGSAGYRVDIFWVDAGVIDEFRPGANK